MRADKTSALIAAVRMAVFAIGVGVAAMTVYQLVSMPPPPPDSDGFAHGMAAMIAILILLPALGLATISVILPTLLGHDDPLGFNRWQRMAFKAAGGLLGIGFVAGTVEGFRSNLPAGAMLLLGCITLATAVVGVVLVWRGSEAAGRRLYRAVANGPA